MDTVPSLAKLLNAVVPAAIILRVPLLVLVKEFSVSVAPLIDIKPLFTQVPAPVLPPLIQLEPTILLFISVVDILPPPFIMRLPNSWIVILPAPDKSPLVQIAWLTIVVLALLTKPPLPSSVNALPPNKLSPLIVRPPVPVILMLFCDSIPAMLLKS